MEAKFIRRFFLWVLLLSLQQSRKDIMLPF